MEKNHQDKEKEQESLLRNTIDQKYEEKIVKLREDKKRITKRTKGNYSRK